LPGYLGYLAFIRDPLEAFEAVLGTAVALFSFEAGPKKLRGMIEMAMKNNPNNPLVRSAVKNFGNVENTGQFSKILISTMLYGMLPTGVSLLTRPLRAKKGGIQERERSSASSPFNTNQEGDNSNRQPDITEDGIPTILPTFQYTSSSKWQTTNNQHLKLENPKPRRHEAFPPMKQYQLISNHMATIPL
jgi:hypothetical protein